MRLSKKQSDLTAALDMAARKGSEYTQAVFKARTANALRGGDPAPFIQEAASILAEAAEFLSRAAGLARAAGLHAARNRLREEKEL
jgi:hypothetical protein